MLSPTDMKQKTGEEAVNWVESGMTIGIGTGTTINWFIKALAKKIEAGFVCTGVPTSEQTKKLASELKIPLLELNDVDSIDLAIDGADQIDPKMQLIKGGGSAFLQEKMVAAASKKLVIIADSSKLVNQLGSFPLPVEVIPYGWKQARKHVLALYDIEITLRKKDGDPFITDHGHYIIDCHFGHIDELRSLSDSLNNIPGVVDNGLFIDMAKAAIIGYPDGTVKTIYPE